MKPFDLEQALAGEPVKLKNGWKAYVKYVFPDDYYKGSYPLRGFCIKRDNDLCELCWTMEGTDTNDSLTSDLDIIGMWEEPRPRVLLELPCPLKEPQVGMWYISSNNQDVYKSSYCKGQNSSFNEDDLDAGRYFASEDDAKEWINAMKEARR